MGILKIDKSIMKMQSFDDAQKDNLFPPDMTVAERLNQSFQLVCTIYGFEKNTLLKIDKTVFSARKFS